MNHPTNGGRRGRHRRRWTATGLLLGVPAVVLLVVSARQIRQRFVAGADDTRIYWLRAGAVIGLCAIGFQSVFDFTLQMPGAAVLFVVLAGLAVHRAVA